MNDTHKIDKEAGLIKLIVGQVCSAGVVHNIYTGDRKCYAVPFTHKVRIDNEGMIISNPTFRGNAIIAFLPKEYENTKIHTCKITKVNKRSVNILPIEYEKTGGENECT